RAAVAQSDHVEGPYEYIGSFRLNSGYYPLDMPDSTRAIKYSADDYDTQKNPWWTPSWHKLIKKGPFFQRDFKDGQMSRDQTLFLDDDGKAYQITSSEENLTLMISELTPDYLSYTGRFVRVAPGGQNEAPTVFKYKKTYWMITSGCTGWAPNAARLFSASSILGHWTKHDNPCVGEKASLTFGGQATYVLKVNGKRSHFIFMADQWRPYSLADSRYIWLPIRFSKKNGKPYLEYIDKWNLHDF
ncbi:MAG: family 43 glycosylhydrolase, partial [Bacteroidaceae bacterium]